MKLFRIYNHLLEKHTIPTKMVTAGFLFGLGDFICQRAVEKKTSANYTWKRTLNLTIVGSLIAAPMLHLWYCHGIGFCLNNLIPRVIPAAAKMNSTQKLFTSIFLDQTFFASLFITTFFISTNYLENGNLSSGINTVKNNYVETILTNWMIWPFAQLINFKFIPLSY